MSLTALTIKHFNYYKTFEILWQHYQTGILFEISNTDMQD